MWPFKKKRSEEQEESKVTVRSITSIICVPGKWESREQFIVELTGAANGEYIAAGFVMMNAKKKKNWSFEFCEYDERMVEAFKVAGLVTRVSDEFLHEINNHRSVVYLSGETGNIEELAEFARAVAAILQAGGIGIKVETAGKAFEKELWLKACEQDAPAVYEMFVLDSIVNENGEVFSCGMHNLGLKDTIIAGEDTQYAIDMIRTFGYYQVVDKPVILNNQTFSMDAESPRFRITDEINQPYKGRERFENPCGMWRLSRAD